MAVIASGHRIILFSPNLIDVSDNKGLHLLIGKDVEELTSLTVPFGSLDSTLRDDGMENDALSTVENLLITMFNGSTNLAMQVSSGAKMMDLGLKS